MPAGAEGVAPAAASVAGLDPNRLDVGAAGLSSAGFAVEPGREKPAAALGASAGLSPSAGFVPNKLTAAGADDEPLFSASPDGFAPNRPPAAGAAGGVPLAALSSGFAPNSDVGALPDVSAGFVENREEPAGLLESAAGAPKRLLGASAVVLAELPNRPPPDGVPVALAGLEPNSPPAGAAGADPAWSPCLAPKRPAPAAAGAAPAGGVPVGVPPVDAPNRPPGLVPAPPNKPPDAGGAAAGVVVDADASVGGLAGVVEPDSAGFAPKPLNRPPAAGAGGVDEDVVLGFAPNAAKPPAGGAGGPVVAAAGVVDDVVLGFEPNRAKPFPEGAEGAEVAVAELPNENPPAAPAGFAPEFAAPPKRPPGVDEAAPAPAAG